jgi:hypothetical protein
MSKKVINRGQLIADAKVLDLFVKEDSESRGMGEM